MDDTPRNSLITPGLGVGTRFPPSSRPSFRRPVLNYRLKLRDLDLPRQAARTRAGGIGQYLQEHDQDREPHDPSRDPAKSTLSRQTPSPGWQPTPVKNISWKLFAILLIGTAGASGQSFSEPVGAATGSSSYQPITGRQRVRWVVKSTVGRESLAAGFFTAGFGTARNSPREYGPHWDGFGKRYGMRLTGISTGNAMEAGFGSLWGEDPRYFRATGQAFKGRIRNIVVMTFAARRADGSVAPAYARFMGNAGNNFLSNSWRTDSESSVGDACVRTLLGVAGRMGSNAFAEFWPDARKYIFHRKH